MQDYLKAFAGVKEISLNKILSKILKSLKRAGLIVKAKYYFRLFNLDEGSKNFTSVPGGENGVDIEKYLARTLREISNLREINEKLTKTIDYSDSFMYCLRKLSKG